VVPILDQDEAGILPKTGSIGRITTTIVMTLDIPSTGLTADQIDQHKRKVTTEFVQQAKARFARFNPQCKAWFEGTREIVDLFGKWAELRPQDVLIFFEVATPNGSVTKEVQAELGSLWRELAWREDVAAQRQGARPHSQIQQSGPRRKWWQIWK
jgi:hypothetical protein